MSKANEPAYHLEIIHRVEYLREYLGLNKSRLAAEIGLRPQTYNSFTGAQGSKPSIDLVHGVCRRFNVNANWLLLGHKPIFVDGGTQALASAIPGSRTALADLQVRTDSLEADMREVKLRLNMPVVVGAQTGMDGAATGGQPVGNGGEGA